MQRTGISVVIACYNCGNTIERCLDSLLNCKYENYELILVNDFSNDTTLEKIEQYAKVNSKIIVVNNFENVGAGETRNTGIKRASKEYITFVDSDDYVDSSFFETIAKSVENYDCDCVIYGAALTNGVESRKLSMFFGGNYKKEQIIPVKEALVYIKGCTWGKAYRTTIIKNNEIKYAAIKRNEDLVFTKVAVSFCEKVLYVPQVLYYYYDNPESLMHDKSLIDKRNALIAYSMINDRLKKRGFDEELHSIYALEIIYSTTITCIKKKDNPNRNYKEVTREYNYSDRYFKRYNLKYRLVLLMLRLRLFPVLGKMV